MAQQFELGGVPVEKLAAKYGLPLYVYDKRLLLDRFMALRDSIAYDRVDIHYACKANSNLSILKLLYHAGACIDAVSPEEVWLAEKAGFHADRILCTGVNFSDEEMKLIKSRNVQLNVGSLNQLRKYGELFPGEAVSIRINPGAGDGHHDHCVTGGETSKFGIYHNRIEQALEIVREYDLNLVGIHSHIGSGILEIDTFIDVMDIVFQAARQVPDLDFIDFGGGIGVPYHPEESPVDLERFGARVGETFSRFCGEYGKRLTLKLEPGRFIVCEAGTLLCEVTDINENDRYTFVGVNSGFNHLVRPVMYDSYHPIINASRLEGAEKDVVIAGYLCESGDIFSHGGEGMTRSVVSPHIGDILAITQVGAYGFSMASNYNMRLMPAEVLVDDGQTYIIRRRQNLNDILDTQVGMDIPHG